MKKRLKPVLIVGTKNSGKTSYLKYLIKKLETSGMVVSGFLSIGSFRENDKQSYILKNIKNGEEFLLAKRTPQANFSVHYGNYHFDPETFKYGNQVLMQNLQTDAIVIDEFGPLESRGDGFWPAMDFLLKNYRGMLFIAVRPPLMQHLKNLLISREQPKPAGMSLS